MSIPQKRIALFGATGTIGDNTLSIIRQYPEQFRISVLTASHNATKLIALAQEFMPEVVVIADTTQAAAIREALPKSIAVLTGEAGLVEAAASEYDCMVSAIVGFPALLPTLTAIRAGRTIALANKECLVAAGALFMEECDKHHATLLPVDSEHNGLFQLWEATRHAAPEHVTLTASGGPFRTFSLADMQHVTPAQAVAHPNWNMGAKISVDSATLMNKGLELIEAQHLFALSPEKLRVLVHPQSIIHCLIGFADGSHLAQLSLPDMRTPLAYALHYPGRLSLDMPKLSLSDIATLTFEAPDTARFPCLQLAFDAMKAGDSAPITLNAANEIAVAAFLSGKISFTAIAELIDRVMQAMGTQSVTSLEEVVAINHLSRQRAETLLV
jgi:1-deoxy-D-xylulose-5-phosphate reductoisomerase